MRLSCGACPPPLQQSCGAEAEVPGGRENEVIDQFQVERRRYPAKAPCRVDVGRAGRRIAGGMVVHQDETFMPARQGLMHNMTRVEANQAAVTIRSPIQMRHVAMVIEEQYGKGFSSARGTPRYGGVNPFVSEFGQMRNRIHVPYLDKNASGGLVLDHPFSTDRVTLGSILNRFIPRLGKNDLFGRSPVIQPQANSVSAKAGTPLPFDKFEEKGGAAPPARWGQSFRVGIRTDAELRSCPYLDRNAHRQLEGRTTYIGVKI